MRGQKMSSRLRGNDKLGWVGDGQLFDDAWCLADIPAPRCWFICYRKRGPFKLNRRSILATDRITFQKAHSPMLEEEEQADAVFHTIYACINVQP